MPNYHPKPIPIKYGVEHPRWKGGRYIDAAGYVCVQVQTGEYIREHRLVMEKHLGRKLSRTELVHHINGDKKDNRIENLELHSRSSHPKNHWENGHDFGRKPPIGIIHCPECQRDRPHGGYGLCNSCYTKWWSHQHPEWSRRLSRERQKRYRLRKQGF